MIIRSAMFLCLLAAPASAAFLRGDVSGNAKFGSGATAGFPDALDVRAGFLDYKASPDLPQIADDLGAYSLVLRAVAQQGPSLLDGFRSYRVSGGIWRDGVLAERLLSKPAQITLGNDTGNARLLLTLAFARPSPTIPLDFRPANGFGLDGRIAIDGPSAGTFTGKFVTAVPSAVPEPGMVALLGLGALALARARAR